MFVPVRRPPTRIFPILAAVEATRPLAPDRSGGYDLTQTAPVAWRSFGGEWSVLGGRLSIDPGRRRPREDSNLRHPV